MTTTGTAATSTAAAAPTGVAHPPLYREVADDIESLIHQGTLLPGTRIPSLRATAKRLSVSVTTAMEAYRLLEDRGLVEVRPQSGHYVRVSQAPPEPARTQTCAEASSLDTADLIERMVEEASRPGLVVPFGAAVPAPEFLPISRLNTLLTRAVRREPVISQSYDSLPGRPELRQEIARLSLAAGCSLTADDLVITAGAQEAIILALRAVTRPGDTVAIETPTYHGFLQALESLHLKALEIATDPREGLCPLALDEAISQRSSSDQRVAAVLLVSSFGNPLGHRMPDLERRQIVEILRRSGVPLIEDDTYGDLGFAPGRPRSLHSFDREIAQEAGDTEPSNVLLLSSFSKTVAPGLRVGWIAPGRYRKDVLRLKYSSSLATATLTQLAIADYLAAGGFERHLRKLRRRFKDLIRRIITEVGEHFPAGTRVTRPAGGYVLWLEMPEAVDAFELHRAALVEKISIAPGPIFSATGRYQNCIRLNCAVPWSDTVAAAIRRIGELATSQITRS